MVAPESGLGRSTFGGGADMAGASCTLCSQGGWCCLVESASYGSFTSYGLVILDRILPRQAPQVRIAQCKLRGRHDVRLANEYANTQSNG